MLPTDGGYAEIVSRNSGQCLSVFGNSTSARTRLVQYPCFGGTDQQRYYTGGSGNLAGTTGKLWSRGSAMVADVAGASADAGDKIEQWPSNGGSNQYFTFTNAIG